MNNFHSAYSVVIASLIDRTYQFACILVRTKQRSISLRLRNMPLHSLGGWITAHVLLAISLWSWLDRYGNGMAKAHIVLPRFGYFRTCYIHKGIGPFVVCLLLNIFMLRRCRCYISCVCERTKSVRDSLERIILWSFGVHKRCCFRFWLRFSMWEWRLTVLF